MRNNKRSTKTRRVQTRTISLLVFFRLSTLSHIRMLMEQSLWQSVAAQGFHRIVCIWRAGLLARPHQEEPASTNHSVHPRVLEHNKQPGREKAKTK
ncbi:hypothetical protein B0T10DRAFT_498357 [Thelonectria olida]|uniref:Uncharacterized protein n=1 Tax=Thelonectria olida TaxID=1576542 RepID=A0A9P9AIP1_9HYPO|nr:hypothetical protein B0T10DRAFT_498357 [Thelonectria olida]